MGNHPETIFYGKQPIRIITMNGVVKFVARDICSILGYARADKMLNPLVDTAPEYISFVTTGGTQPIRVVNLDDLETVLARCRNANAPRLRAWLRRHARSSFRNIMAFGIIFE